MKKTFIENSFFFSPLNFLCDTNCPTYMIYLEQENLLKSSFLTYLGSPLNFKTSDLYVSFLCFSLSLSREKRCLGGKKVKEGQRGFFDYMLFGTGISGCIHLSGVSKHLWLPFPSLAFSAFCPRICLSQSQKQVIPSSSMRLRPERYGLFPTILYLYEDHHLFIQSCMFVVHLQLWNG